jgi:hypothetical protein
MGHKVGVVLTRVRRTWSRPAVPEIDHTIAAALQQDFFEANAICDSLIVLVLASS